MPLCCPAPLRQGVADLLRKGGRFTPKGRPICSESLAFLLRDTQSYFIIPLLLLVLASFFSVIFALFTLIDSIINRNPGQLLTFLIELLVAGVLLFVPCAFSWIMELNAEFQAIKVIGLDAFLDIRNNLKKSPKPSRGSKIIIRMTHPPNNVTVRCWKWLHKNKGVIL